MLVPASAGLGVMATLEIVGAIVLSETVLVTSVNLPAKSVERTTIVLEPCPKVMALVKLPPLTVTAP